MKIVILQNIVSSNNVHSINSLMKKYSYKKKDVKVFFCAETESNRRWNLHEKPLFSYEVLPQFALKLQGKDLFTYFVNTSILRVLRKENPDRIIIGGWDQFAYQLAVIWGRLNSKHVTLWSGSTKYEKSWRRLAAWPLVRLLVYCSSDFIAYGIQAKDYLISLGAREKKIDIFPNDVNSSYFFSQAKKYRLKRSHLKKKYKINYTHNFLYVGQLIERKGILDLLEAYANFSKKNDKWGLVIIGYGYLEDKIKRIIEEKKLRGVVMLGSIEQYSLPSYYVACDCLILPSREEVWGLVVNEALACRLSVIVSNICGCVSDLKSQVNIFESGNIRQLEKKMLEISKRK